jgi:hypothetical protein
MQHNDDLFAFFFREIRSAEKLVALCLDPEIFSVDSLADQFFQTKSIKRFDSGQIFSEDVPDRGFYSNIRAGRLHAFRFGGAELQGFVGRNGKTENSRKGFNKRLSKLRGCV